MPSLNYPRFWLLGPWVAMGLVMSLRGETPRVLFFVKDKNTIFIPDRLGNNRTDTLSNIIDNKGIGVLFLVPGMNETLRVNGFGTIILDEEILRNLSAQGKPPKSALKIEVKEAYLQCAKALIRSKLWKENYKIERDNFPTLGEIITDQIGLGDDSAAVAAANRSIQKGYEKKLY